MRKILLIILLACLLLTGCSAGPVKSSGGSAPYAPQTSATPSETPGMTAEDHALGMIESALQALATSPRDDLSTVSYPFEDAYAYSGSAEDAITLYGSKDEVKPLSNAAESFLNEVCDLVIENMPQDASAYDKYRYLAYFLSEATDYDETFAGGLMSITPYGAIVGGHSVCIGYTTAYLYLCEKADLWCCRVYGYSEEGIHGWNLVKLEDGTYYVDVTWCDGLGQIGTEDWQRYFMLTEDVLLDDHGVWDGGPAAGTTLFN